MSLVSRRIIGKEKKRRITVSVRMEKELFEAIKRNKLSLSDVVNVAVEDYLRKRGFLKIMLDDIDYWG